VAGIGALLLAACAHAQTPPPGSPAGGRIELRTDGAGERDAGSSDALVNPAAVAAANREVTLDELLAFAERNSPALQIAVRRRRYGEAAREGASPLLRENPTLAFGIGPRFDTAGTSGYDFAASLGQPIEIAGQRGLRLDAADRLGERLDADVAAARWEIRRQVTLAYRAAIVGRERVRIADSLVAFAEEMLRIARRRLAAGEATAIDVRVAEGDTAQARQAKILAEQELRQAQLTLCELTGWPIETPPVPRGALEAPRPVPALRDALAVAAERHPELRAKRAAVAEAHARAELADREAWPTPTFGAAVAREGHRSGPGSEGTNYIVLGTIGLPLPFWQRNQGERARAHVDEEVAQTEQSAASVALRARIARAHAELQAAAERLRLFASTVAPSLEDSLALLRRGFDAGEIPLLNVAVARERFLQTQRDALRSYADYYRALAELEYVVGASLTELDSRREGEAR
jgi:cobalt-zinc-cadmium efflux system outer membrane protein